MLSALSFSLILLASQALASPHGALQSRQDSTPSVDLGYEVHTGTENVRKRFLGLQRVFLLMRN